MVVMCIQNFTLFHSIKIQWAGIILGFYSDHAGQKVKIENSFLIKEHFEVSGSYIQSVIIFDALLLVCHLTHLIESHRIRPKGTICEAFSWKMVRNTNQCVSSVSCSQSVHVHVSVMCRCYNVASVPWYLRRAASMVLSSPPTSSYEEVQYTVLLSLV